MKRTLIVALDPLNNIFLLSKDKPIKIISLESFDVINWDPDDCGVYYKAFRIIHETPILDKSMGGAEISVTRQKNQNSSKFDELAFFSISSLGNR